MTADISFLDLFLQASLLVKMVMLTLLGMSVASWAAIIKRSKIIASAEREADAFEDRFWSGMDLVRYIKMSKNVKMTFMASKKFFMPALLSLHVYAKLTQEHQTL